MSSIRVLLVDDDPFSIRTVEEALLDEEGFEIVGMAADGDSAIDMARRLRPDLVVTDIDHPGPDGFAVTCAIMEQIDGVKVLVYSGYGVPSYVERSRLAGATGFVVKPEHRSVLTNAIKTVAGGGGFVSPGLAPFVRTRRGAARRPKPDR